MRCCVALAALVAAAGCGKREEHAPTPPVATPATPTSDAAALGTACEKLTFAESTPVPEASGAAWLDIDGALSLVVIADSGHQGAFGILDPDTGVTRLQGQLPLGTGASDDLEGLAARGTRLYGLTSAGYLREWEWSAGAFKLVAGPYPISKKPDLVCDPTKVNCGKNYEGLAIPPRPIEGCDLVACAKADGRGYCFAGQPLEMTRSFPITSKKDALADCSFSDTGVFYAGMNLFGLSHVLQIPDIDKAEIRDLGPLGTGFPEVVAARGDIVYRMSDVGGDTPSMMLEFRCPAPGR